MTEPVLLMDHVTKKIRKTQIIHGVSLQVEQGEIVALCGVNGAGKSTLLRMIAGISQPTSGVITINGLRWKKHRKAYAQQIGYMPDDYLFGQGLTAKETLGFWAALREIPEERVEEMLHMVGLSEFKRKTVSSFSKGMRQRLLFAQAMLAKPELLILDEPTNGLDPYWMDSFVELVRQVKEEGQSVIFSTHQLPIAEVAADRVIFLKDGSIVEEGTVQSYKIADGYAGLQLAFNRMLGLHEKRD